LLPEDVFVCIRESERKYLDLARAAWGKRRFQLYYEYAMDGGWWPYFTTTPLWTKSLHYPSHDDILYGDTWDLPWSDVTALLGAECAWNVNRPGAGEFTSKAWQEIGTKLAPPPERRTFAERACRFWFGDQAGPLMAPVFAENISQTFIAFPDEVLKGQKSIEDPARTMLEQSEAAARAAESLDRLWTLQENAKVLAGDELGYFLNLYRMTHGARILATYRAHVMTAQAAMRRGDRTNTEKCLTAAREFLGKAAAEWDAVQQRAPKDKLFCARQRKTAAPGLLTELDISELSKEVDDLWARREQIIGAYTLPKWFERTCRRREIVAAVVPASVPAGRDAGPTISADGKLDEPAWQNAPRAENFLDYRVPRLESLETCARLLYDEKTLFVAFECFDPNPAEIKEALPDRDVHALCDSVELFVAPRKGVKEFAHWIVDSKGTIFDARSVVPAGEPAKYSEKWNGKAQVAVVRAADRWIVEMAIPASDLGVSLKPGADCLILLCRNIVHTRQKGEEESNAVVFLDKSNFHAVDKFATLEFGEQGTKARTPRVVVELTAPAFGQETIADGTGTRVGGELSVETDANLHDFRLSATFTDGVKPLGTRELGKAPLVRLLWWPEKAFSEMFANAIAPGIVATFKVTSREGEWSFVRRFGSPKRGAVPAGELYGEGVDGKKQGALAAPAFFPASPATIRLEEGTIEFWVKPRWNAERLGDGPGGDLAHTFLQLGPIRPEHPYLANCDSVRMAYTADGHLTCSIANFEYESRSIETRIDWRKGDWHHLAWQWKLDDAGKTTMALFIDGKQASTECEANKKGDENKPLKMKPLSFSVQIGAMTTGVRPADAEIDELRISSSRRYAAAFTPAKRFEPDDKTLTLFHFDESLDAAVPAGVKATAGPAQ
jgi:hypothetical protein